LTWEYVPAAYGTWIGRIVNSGLRSVVVDVSDSTTGTLEEIMHQRIRFAACDAYPSGAVNTSGVVMSHAHKYLITVTPNGPKGSSCSVEDMFLGPMPPVMTFSVVVNQMSVIVDAIGSYDPDGTIVSYYWSFGDGGGATGITATHTYSLPATYTITLTVTDNDNLTNTASRDVVIRVVPPGNGSWSNPVLIGAPVNDIASGPSVSMNSRGLAIAAWSSMRDSVWQVWTNKFVPGLGWQGPEAVGPAMPWTYAPVVGIDDNGNSSVAWIMDNTIYTRRNVPAYGWDDAVVVSDAVTYPSGLTLAVDPDGKAVLAWEAQVDLHWGIMASVRDVGNHWSVPTLIESSRGQADNPCAAISDGGKAIVAFGIYESTQSDVWANSYAPGAGWLGETLLSDLGNYSSGPKVSMDTFGNAFAVWDYMTASNYTYTYTVCANRYVGGVWQGAVRIEPGSASAPMSPDVRAYGDGNAAVVWTERTDPLPAGEIRTSTYRSGIGWSSPVTIGSGSLYVGYPSVAVDSSGGIYVGWSQSDGLGNVSGYVILTNHYGPGLGWSGQQLMMWVQNTSGPVVAAGPSNTAVLVWNEFGTTSNVWASDYGVRTVLVAEAGPTQYLWGQDSVQFDGSGSYSDNGIVSYLWTWIAGNGTEKSLTGANPSCTSEWFFSYGNYTVTLTVTDSSGKTATDTVSIVFGFRIYCDDPMGAEGITAPSDGYYKLRIENNGMQSFNWTIVDCNLTSPPYDVFHDTITFSSDNELLVTGPFWMTGGRYYQSEYIPHGPAGSYMTIFAFFVPTA
jgi:PKD repeat protein